MPLPAGTGLDRRTFLLRSAGAALSVYGASMLSPRHFEEGIAQASAAAGPNQPVLVSIFMEGGWDALSVLAPVKEAKYKELRPTLGLAEGDRQGLHRGRKPDVASGRRAALPNSTTRARSRPSPRSATNRPDESHFTSRHYWEVGQLDANVRTGWMGRYLDVAGDPDNPLQGLSLDYSLAPALATAKMPVAAVSSPADYTMWANGLGEPISGPALETFGALGAFSAPSPAYAQARNASYDTGLVLEKMAGFVQSEKESGDTSPVTYPTGDFAERLAVLAAMLHTEMPIKCASMNAVGSYDTHSSEAETLSTNLQQTVAAVVAFQRDLEARKLDQRVLIQLWSEFGRRPEENGSGTDHGAGGAAFLIGSRASGKMVGEFPGLSKLDVNDNVLRPRTSARCTARCWSSGSKPKPAWSSRKRRSFERPVLVR